MKENIRTREESQASLRALGEQYDRSAQALTGRIRALRENISTAPLKERQDLICRLRILYTQHAYLRATARCLAQYYQEEVHNGAKKTRRA